MFTRGGTMVCDGCQLDKIIFSEFGSCCRKYQCNSKHNCGENASSSTVVTGKEIARNIYYTASLLKSSWTWFHGFLLYAFQFTSGVNLFVWSSVYDPFFFFHSKTHLLFIYLTTEWSHSHLPFNWSQYQFIWISNSMYEQPTSFTW